MRAGTLTDTLVVYRPDVRRSATGEQLTEYKEVMSVRCEVVTQSGTRSLVNEAVEFPYRKTFRVRYQNKIDERDRLGWNGKTFRVLSVDANRQLMMTTVTAEEIVTNN